MSVDHRQLGRDLALFRTDTLVGAGLPLWLPDGAVIRGERRARGRRVPYVAVIGHREAASGLLAVRLRDGRQLPAISAADLIAEITRQVACRSARDPRQPVPPRSRRWSRHWPGSLRCRRWRRPLT